MPGSLQESGHVPRPAGDEDRCRGQDDDPGARRGPVPGAHPGPRHRLPQWFAVRVAGRATRVRSRHRVVSRCRGPCQCRPLLGSTTPTTAVPRNRLSGQAHHGLRASGRQPVDRRLRGARPAHGGLRLLQYVGEAVAGRARPQQGGRPSKPSTPVAQRVIGEEDRIRGGSHGSAAGMNGSVPSPGLGAARACWVACATHPRPGWGCSVIDALSNSHR